MRFAYSRCRKIIEGMVDLIQMCDEVETVNGFRYLGEKLSASGRCEAVVTVRVRFGWVRF